MADEPVSMLDASVRTEILALLLELKKRRDLTYLFITHDLGLAWILADRIAVMYLGKIVETGDGAEIIRNPRHPYTKALISVVPSPNPFDSQGNNDTWGQLSGLSAFASINYEYGDTFSITIKGSSGGGTFR